MRSAVNLYCRIGAILLLLSLAQACKSPEEVFENEPLFKISGTIDSSFFDLTAGRNGYYMHTSYETDTLNISAFTAELKKDGCFFSCPASLSIRLRNNTEGDQPADMSAASAPGSYFYRNPDSVVYGVNFQALPSGQPSYDASWDFGDGTQSNELNPTHIYSNQGTYNVCLSIDYGNGCTNSICNDVYVGEKSCAADFSYIDSGTTFVFTPMLQGTPSFTYYFDYGAGQDTSTIHTFPDTGIYKVCLYSIDSAGCESFTCKNIRVSSPTSCMTNFSYEAGPLPLGADLSLIIIEWIDEFGNSYRSELEEQPPFAYFRILESEEYLANEKGNKTRKLKVEFDCMLYSGSASRHLKANGTIAVGHP